MTLIEFLNQTGIQYRAGITEFVILDATDKKIIKLIAFCDENKDERCFDIINGQFVVS